VALPTRPDPIQFLLFPNPPRWRQLSIQFPPWPKQANVKPCFGQFLLKFTGFTGGYERDGIFNREDVFNFLYQKREFNGDWIRLVSQRYFLFRQNYFCVRCGLEGLYFAKERSAKMVKIPTENGHRHTTEYRAMNTEQSSWHLNMYALKLLPDGGLQEVLMTKDHIIPRAKGGLDIMSNYQTMCSICNGHKADKLIDIVPVHQLQPPVEVPELKLPELAMAAVE